MAHSQPSGPYREQDHEAGLRRVKVLDGVGTGPRNRLGLVVEPF